MSNTTLYFVKFTERVCGKSFYKFGYTGQNVQKRFDPYFANSRYFDDRFKYLEFSIEEISTVMCTLDFAKRAEKLLKDKFPKNFYLETYLNKPYNYYNNGFTGITEVVLLSDELVSEIKDTYKKLSEHKGYL